MATTLSRGVLLGLLLCIGSLAQAQTYDATADFNPGTFGNNPNGVWSYGYTTTLGGSFITHAESGLFGGQLQFWRTNLANNVPTFEKNIGATPLFGIQPGQLALHGGPSGEFGLLRFTVPSTGAYDIATSYFAGDVGDTDIYLLHNGSVVASSPSTSVGGSFSLSSFLLNANDTLDVAVGIGGDFYFGDTTPLTHIISVSSAPEPGTLGLLGLGLVGGAVRRARKGARQ